MAIESKNSICFDKRNCCSLKVHSCKMFNDLGKLGVIPNKTKHEIIPNINQDMMRHFIRGFFDGDGWCTNTTSHGKRKGSRKCIGFVSNYEFLDNLNESMLKTFTNVEKLLFYYLKLIPLVDNFEINVTQKNIFEINQKSKISIEQFITIFCTLLKNLKIAYNYADSKTLYLKKYDISFTISNKLDETPVTINDNILYLKVKEYLENTKEQQAEFKNNVELYTNKINLSDNNKIYLLIKLLTRKSTIQNYNDQYKIEFYRKKNDINYNFYTLIKLKDRNLFIDLNSKTKVNPIRIISTDELTSYEKIYI